MELIDKQTAINAILGQPPEPHYPSWYAEQIKQLQPAQPEQLFLDTYAKAVWTWLLDYQIKAAELEGRYTPYEVLSWVANDWRKGHDMPSAEPELIECDPVKACNEATMNKVFSAYRYLSMLEDLKVYGYVLAKRRTK